MYFLNKMKFVSWGIEDRKYSSGKPGTQEVGTQRMFKVGNGSLEEE